jgi:hypothetical protein
MRQKLGLISEMCRRGIFSGEKLSPLRNYSDVVAV